MWKAPYHDDRLVTINFYPHAVACSIIERAASGAPFVLKAYQRVDLHNLELEQLIVFNPTKLKRIVYTFLQKHAAQHAFIACTLRGPHLFEKYITMQNQKPKHRDFALPELNSLVWDYRVVYPTDHGKSVFYVAGLPRTLIAQYQLFAIAAQLHMTTLIPEQMALLQVYRYQRGAAFRRTQLAVDMLQHHNMIDYICTTETLGRILHIPSHLVIDRAREASSLLASCGLFISERVEDEKY